jgi:hypothetical protein
MLPYETPVVVKRILHDDDHIATASCPREKSLKLENPVGRRTRTMSVLAPFRQAHRGHFDVRRWRRSKPRSSASAQGVMSILEDERLRSTQQEYWARIEWISILMWMG